MTLESLLTSFAQRTAAEDKALRTLINGNNANLSALTTTDKTTLVAALNELKGLIDDVDQALIDDGVTASNKTWSSSRITSAVNDAIDNIVAGAPAALDTLQEIAAELAADNTQAAAIISDLGTKVGITAQTFTAPQQAQARANIGAQSAAEIGSTTTNYVAIFEAALV